MSQSAYYYKPIKRSDDEKIKEILKQMATNHIRWGFDKMMSKMKRDGYPWNHKRVYRIYCEIGLNIRVKPRKRLPKGEAVSLFQPIKPNVCWSIDFMSDALRHGRKFRTFNVIDDYNREAILVAPDFTLPAIRVTQLLDQIATFRGYPEMIRVDHGPEFESYVFKRWARKHNILICFIQPGKPAQNGFIERFNRTYREDVLDIYLFDHLNEVKTITREWINTYNHVRPHESIGNQSPRDFASSRSPLLGKQQCNAIGEVNL